VNTVDDLLWCCGVSPPRAGRRIENPWLVAGDAGEWRSALETNNGVANDRWNAGGMIFNTVTTPGPAVVVGGGVWMCVCFSEDSWRHHSSRTHRNETNLPLAA
jgi:hypothetical protein